MCDYCGCEAREERRYMEGLARAVEDGDLCPKCQCYYSYNEEAEENECACTEQRYK